MGRWSGESCRLSTMMFLTSSFFLVEIIIGYVTNSIALVADSFHMLSDVAALIVGFASVRISKWQSSRNTYGWQRAEVLGALVNSVFLLALCFSIVVESVKRLLSVEEVENPLLVLAVGIVGLLVNVLGLCVLGGHGHSHGGKEGHGHGHSHGDHSHSVHKHLDDSDDRETLASFETVTFQTTSHNDPHCSQSSAVDVRQSKGKTKVIKHSGEKSLNMQGVFLHVLGDALGSVVVVISALVIYYVDADWKYYLDPGMSLLMVIIILGTTMPLFRETAYILLQTVPRHVNVEAITNELKEIDGIAGVHEVHIWQLAGRRIIASAHVHCHDIHEYMALANQVKNVFHKAGIHSTTIQPEFTQGADDPKMCSLLCDTEDGTKCEQDTCCGPRVAARNGRACQQTNNSNSNDEVEMLAAGDDCDTPSQRWKIDIELSPDGDEVVLDLSKRE